MLNPEVWYRILSWICPFDHVLVEIQKQAFGQRYFKSTHKFGRKFLAQSFFKSNFRLNYFILSSYNVIQIIYGKFWLYCSTVDVP